MLRRMPGLEDPATPFKRPRAGTWLDVSAGRIEAILREKYGLVGMSPEVSYQHHVQRLEATRGAMAMQLQISNAAAQRYFDEDTFQDIAAQVAATLSDENPGANPWRDPKTIDVATAEWMRAALGIQLAARALEVVDEDYAWSIVGVCSNMSVVLLEHLERPMSPRVMAAPDAGTRYVVRILRAAAELIDDYGVGVDELTTDQLSRALERDADALQRRLDDA